MISTLVYVKCDKCGDPAEAVVGGAKEARIAARAQGFIYRGKEDICPNCQTRPGYRWYYDVGWVRESDD